MPLTLSILPVALLILLMTSPRPRRWLPLPAHVALPLVALLAYGLQLFYFAPGQNHPQEGIQAWSNRTVHAAAIDGLLSALTPLAIVFGAILLFKTMEQSGAMNVVTAGVRALSPDPIAQLVLVGWSFSFLIEGLSGFGTPAALAAPILVGLGAGRFSPLRIAAMCLVMNSVPVSFGAVGTPTWFGLGEVGLTPGELLETGWRTAIIHSVAAPVIVLLALRIVVPWSLVRARWRFILFAVVTSVGPYLTAARFSVEFPSIVGGLCGLVGAGFFARGGIGLPPLAPATHAGTPEVAQTTGPKMSLLRASMPLWATVLVLAVTRIDALGIKSLLTSDAGEAGLRLGSLGRVWISPSLVVGLRDILGTSTAWRMPLLYVPFILPFVAVSLLAIPVLRMRPPMVRGAWTQTVLRLTRPAIALVGALVLVKMMMAGGADAPTMRMGRAMAAAAGEAWPYFAALLGALGAFFSGSSTVSNLTFAPIQAAIARDLDLHVPTVLALQSAGGAMGNMVCIHNIVAVAALLGLVERRSGSARTPPPGTEDENDTGVAAVLRMTFGPMLVYALIAGGVAFVFIRCF